jgi:ACT domain-containing protein
MNILEGWNMYLDIQDLKKKHFNVSQISRRLDLSRTTVYKYLDISPEGWIQIAQSQKIKSTLDIEVGGCRVTVDESTDPELLTQLSDQKNWL